MRPPYCFLCFWGYDDCAQHLNRRGKTSVDCSFSDVLLCDDSLSGSSCSRGTETQYVFPLSLSLLSDPVDFWTKYLIISSFYDPTPPDYLDGSTTPNRATRDKIQYEENLAENGIYLKVTNGSIASKATAKLLNNSANTNGSSLKLSSAP
ncbi:hypothetical protein DFH08DRAFT_879955 [Mycena albidolilacea]|uniref:Uncharacterized protein n=1 Tax=Mycena albidolilacea TaxID=1033008 RepID=A0AAD7EM00_9AGAR|nr:hypothetical protein DFH08DRAFT_879955 [Mycena albidolilacea]